MAWSKMLILGTRTLKHGAPAQLQADGVRPGVCRQMFGKVVADDDALAKMCRTEVPGTPDSGCVFSPATACT